MALESTIGGGAQNSIRIGSAASTISGGLLNMINSDAYESVIGGGRRNTIGTNASFAVISGGVSNTVSEQSSTLLPLSWGAAPSGGANPATIPLSTSTRFYRLRKP